MLQTGGWFFTPGCTPMPLSHLIEVYHQSVGRNGVLELDFGIDREGLVEASQAERYAEFGEWIRRCYDNPVATVKFEGTSTTLEINETVDRIMLREDLQYGQRVRGFTVFGQKSDSVDMIKLSNGMSIGNKRIDLFKNDLYSRFFVNITSTIGTPKLTFSVFKSCPDGKLLLAGRQSE